MNNDERELARFADMSEEELDAELVAAGVDPKELELTAASVGRWCMLVTEMRRERDEARVALAAIARDVRDWICESCRTVYPGPQGPAGWYLASWEDR